ncbi:glutathione binding-like protein [Oscillatoria sp. CS-180]|uniref:glutathione S-transferase family protein n=1 Tax=Oscillatoria sp. CS-180 TaxID=3021720 RepID=UPI00232DFC79|nr:glutathione binding-like protein [Oscillatoria sp. CS-180]MDB9526738.1 glutathione binding-like protein [Oscillatoria sp. CS-180]
MIDLYTFTTPNGRKPVILLEEIQLPYTVKMVDISKDEQFSPEFVALNPNSKIPVIVDTETDITVFESGAILIYLAEKTGSELWPQAMKPRMQVLEWLMFQMASVGPMMGQHSHFKRSAPDNEYGIKRYRTETLRLFSVMDRQLSQHDYLAGKAYSIADIATYPWVMTYDFQGLTLDEHPNLKRWTETLGQRPAIQTGMALKK